MVGTIGPVVHRATGINGVMILGIHTFGYVASGIGTGFALYGVQRLAFGHMLNEKIGIGSVSVLALVYSIGESGIFRVPMPQFTAQVPASWQFFSPGTMALLYGLGLGCGFATRITVSTFYVAAAWALVCDSPSSAGFTLGCFGLGRALPIWLSLKSYAFCSRASEAALFLKNAIHMINSLALSAAGSGLLWSLIYCNGRC